VEVAIGRIGIHRRGSRYVATRHNHLLYKGSIVTGARRRRPSVAMIVGHDSKSNVLRLDERKFKW
jgi:hypothetical protein